MHEKFRHFIEDFQMKVCPAPPNLELLDFGCPPAPALAELPQGTCACLAVSSPVPWHAAHTPLQMGWQGAVLGARGRYGVGREAVSPSPFTNSCGDGQKFLREIQCTACSLSHCSSLALSITGALQPLRWLLGCSQCPQASLQLLGVPGTTKQPESTRVPGHCGLQPQSCCWFQSLARDALWQFLQ